MTNRFPITVSFKVKTTSSSDQYLLTLGRSNTFDGESIYRIRSGYASQWSFKTSLGYPNSDNAANRSTVQVNDGQWHDITWVNTGADESSGIKIYIDGVLNKTVTGSVGLTSTIMFIALLVKTAGIIMISSLVRYLKYWFIIQD